MIKNPNFIEIRGAGARKGSEYISINKNGTISLYAGFYSKKNIKSFSECIFLVDKKQNLLGIQFGHDKEFGDGAYRINHTNKMATIYAGNIFVDTELNVNEWYGKYIPEQYENADRKNVYMIDLDKKIPIIRKTKKDKKVI